MTGEVREFYVEERPVPRCLLDLTRMALHGRLNFDDFELPNEDRWILGDELTTAPMSAIATGELLVMTEMAAPHKIVPRDPRRHSPAKPRQTEPPRRGRQSQEQAGRTKPNR
jgi:hypothetical protein